MEKHPAAKTAPLPAPSRPGITLVELMISVLLISVGIAAMMQSFGFIQRAIQSSKNKTLASNLAQEKMQILKQKSYYQVLVTSDPVHNTVDFAPETMDYDAGYFPPEEVSEAGVSYTRYTLIQPVREDSGEIVVLPPATPDSGMRLITVHVVWRQGASKRKLSLRSVLANPNTVMTDSVFTGHIFDSASLGVITGAVVNIAENVGWRDISSESGKYTISVSPGNFNIVISANGYFTELRTASIATGQTQTQDFYLVKMATGTVTGTAWLRDHLVISQVVGATVSASGFCQEFVELFNPTTAYVPLSVGASTSLVKLKLRNYGEAEREIALHYAVEDSSMQPNSYFLIANTGTVTAAGVARSADAVYSPSNTDYPDLIRVSGGGCGKTGGDADSVWIESAAGAVIDAIGWDTNPGAPHVPHVYEGDAIDQTIGLQENEQYIRASRPGSVANGEGRAYDSNTNNLDFRQHSPLSHPPRNSSDVDTLYAATPAIGAVVTASDGLSASAQAQASGSPPSAVFTLVDVATGTWTVLISSGQYMLQDDTVTIPAVGSVYNFPSSTTFLTQEATQGIITGRVLNISGSPILVPSAIVVSPGDAGAQTTASPVDGRYRILVSTGVVDVTANPSNSNSYYISASSIGITITLGEVHSGVDFLLPQGTRISGFVTRDGINPLPGVVVSVADTNGVSVAQPVSGLDGRFTSASVSTGTYAVEPAMASTEQSVPSSTTVLALTPGGNIFSSTFTITGAMGYITGAVTSGGAPIRTGVLLVVTTSTLSGTPPAPPALSAATLAQAPYYMVSSMEDGTYRIEARQATSPKYRVYAYYPTPSASAVTILSTVTANVQVLSGQTTTGVNFSW